MKPYDLDKKWRKFKPYLDHPEVRRIENLTMQLMHPEYVAGRHVPREAGKCIDVPWPRSRTGAKAYQCFGYCHCIAPVILALARLADPKYEWCLLNAVNHTVVLGVIDMEGTPPYDDSNWVIIDINSYDESPESIIEQFTNEIMGDPTYRIEDDLDNYIFTRLGPHFKSQYPMRPSVTGWQPEEGAWEHYEVGERNETT